MVESEMSSSATSEQHSSSIPPSFPTGSTNDLLPSHPERSSGTKTDLVPDGLGHASGEIEGKKIISDKFFQETAILSTSTKKSSFDDDLEHFNPRPAPTIATNSNNNNRIITHPPSITLTLFENWNNPNITWKTKFKSFTATLFINLFLPFMNGVMLGFGEIAAKEIIGNFFGWGPAHRYRHQKEITHRLSSSSNRRLLPDLMLTSNTHSESNPSSQNQSDSSSL